eukprot:jgi/Ulvmu1/3514/UM162_0021.1
MGAQNMDEVSINAVWTEAIVREARCLRMNENFGGIRSPQTMTMLPEKPNNTVPLSKPTNDEVKRAKATLENLCIVKDSDMTPSQRHVLPITSSQEVGWFTTPLVQPQPLFHHPKGQCDVTLYADTYASMAGGKSPFAKAPE